MFEAKDPSYEKKVRESFALQRVMQTIGASLESVGPGEVTISLPFRDDLTQQDGFIHAGITAAIADSACGYAAYSLMPPGASVLSIEFKQNLLSPAVGESFVAMARVIRPGRRIFVVRCEVFALLGGKRKHIAEMQATIMCIEG
jgi:uncharacterized protein (TIGR00369 family)